ncbi:cytochrome P450 [Lophiostoma macrostomum CBS 122681]|uniref:Cytochrome P450 n=1 Tax=Lophiostoma macrostomum CBS 122681 TaxID=1314788 RepID=A0A6A6SKQ2_9PLEO|nr:cytochrome P450 [Lophiostoma macrostomum CBS 122681]
MFLNVIFSVFVVCLVTRVWTGYAYYHHRGKEPPTFPYWIPVLGHGASLLHNGSRFLAVTFKSHGTTTPFFVKTGSFKTLILSDPIHIRRILRDNNDISAEKHLYRLYETMLGSPADAVAFYQKDKSLPKQEQTTAFLHSEVFKQKLFGPALIPISERFLSTFRQNVLTTYIIGTVTMKGWMDIPDLYDFMEHLMTRTLMETICGTMILEGYPGFVTDFWAVVERFEGFIKGVPRIFMPGAYLARGRLLRHFRQWGRRVKKHHEIRNSKAMIDPDWDHIVGSSLLQEREKALSQMPLNEDARASEMLGMTLAANGNVVPTTFWCIFEALLDPKLRDDLSGVIKQHYNPDTKGYDITQLSSAPHMQSMHAEATRLRNAATFSRFVETESVTLDDRYSVLKDTTVLVMAHHLGLRTESWEEARPGTTEKPLDVFWAQRFLVSENTGDKTKEKFTTSRLGACLLPFGGGSHKCPGRHFAKNIGIAAMAILLDEYEIELQNPESARGATPKVEDMAFGVVKPTRKVAARIRMRDT